MGGWDEKIQIHAPAQSPNYFTSAEAECLWHPWQDNPSPEGYFLRFPTPA